MIKLLCIQAARKYVVFAEQTDSASLRNFVFAFGTQYIDVATLKNNCQYDNEMIINGKTFMYGNNVVHANRVVCIDEEDELMQFPKYKQISGCPKRSYEIVDFMEAQKYDFTFWYYQLTHGDALVRSENDGYNIDMIFCMVKYIDMPIDISKKGKLVNTEEKDIEYLEGKLNISLSWEDVHVFEFNSVRKYIVGKKVTIVKDNYNEIEIPIDVF